MSLSKGVFKGVVAVLSGAFAQNLGYVPTVVFGGELAAFGRFSGFVVGAFVGLVVADLLTGDVTPNKPVVGFAKGLSSAVGAAIGVLVLADFGPFVTLCASPLGPILRGFAGACYPFLELVSGTFVGVVVGDLFLAPFGR